MTGWWPGDGNSDDLVGGRNAVLHDHTTTGPGFVGEGFVLDGAGDFVEVPHDPALNVGTGDFTVDFWVYFNTLCFTHPACDQILIEKYVETLNPATRTGWSIAYTPTPTGPYGVRFFGASGTPDVDFGAPNPNTWIHYALRREVHEAEVVYTAFVNGRPVAFVFASSSSNLDSISSLKFGHRGNPDDTPGSNDTRGFYLNGRIDEVELFVGRALSDAEIQDIVMADSAGKCKFPMEELTSLSPATLWVGLKNSDAVGLRLDLQAEVFLNEAKVGEGVLNNVASGSSGFNNAKLHEIPLTLFAPVEVPADAEWEITLSVRQTCSGGGHNSSTPRLWYTGQPIDSGSTRDAGTRFGATIAGTTSAFFLHDGFALSTTAGTAKKFVDILVDNKTPCPNRPFTSFGTWSRTLP